MTAKQKDDITKTLITAGAAVACAKFGLAVVCGAAAGAIFDFFARGKCYPNGLTEEQAIAGFVKAYAEILPDEIQRDYIINIKHEHLQSWINGAIEHAKKYCDTYNNFIRRLIFEQFINIPFTHNRIKVKASDLSQETPGRYDIKNWFLISKEQAMLEVFSDNEYIQYKIQQKDLKVTRNIPEITGIDSSELDVTNQDSILSFVNKITVKVANNVFNVVVPPEAREVREGSMRYAMPELNRHARTPKQIFDFFRWVYDNTTEVLSNSQRATQQLYWQGLHKKYNNSEFSKMLNNQQTENITQTTKNTINSPFFVVAAVVIVTMCIAIYLKFK